MLENAVFQDYGFPCKNAISCKFLPVFDINKLKGVEISFEHKRVGILRGIVIMEFLIRAHVFGIMTIIISLK